MRGTSTRSLGTRSRIDDALELAAAVNRGPMAPAVAGAWAAVESLPTHPDDPKGENERSGKAVAADRMAAVIACSWPRAELTALAHHHKPGVQHNLYRGIAACATNQERARLTAEALQGGGASVLGFTGAATKYSDGPAAQRMADLRLGGRLIRARLARRMGTDSAVRPCVQRAGAVGRAYAEWSCGS
ncbi:hypothetical protein [Streptomyces sp. NBC_00568]|uniref:hypothetical protein n=1 Tax=Streptomyces sp. NBC_00568 TaxID=2975779 RepID=UPI002255A04B|nr:hypothetical protein [Streptomyces sp. NBC_00568]MCX4993475.1 hypothetical protein [Streptomyces sp. NBC_00568]